MLQHSASAIYLPRRPRDSSLGPRTFSTTSIGGNPSCKTAHGVAMQTSLTSSTSTRLGLSDEETCSRSDTSSCRTALMHRASSFVASRRGSSEAFEDALESLDPPHPASDLSNDYSSYAFIHKALPSDTPGSQAEVPTRASPQGNSAEVSKAQASTTNRDARSTDVCCNTTSMPSNSSKSNERNEEERAAREARSTIRECPVSSPRRTPRSGLHICASQQQKGKGKDQQQERSTAAAAAADSVNSSRCREEYRSSAVPASERQEGFVAPSGSLKSPSAKTDQRKDAGGALFPRAASQEGRRVNVPKRAIGRYSSVPAFSAADRVRIDRFKEGLPECLSTQEAINKQRKAAAEEERMRRRAGGLPAAVELGEAVDWRSLLDAAGLGDVAEDEITLEAEELHAKLQEFAPRAGPGWCLSLLGCLWQWRM